MVNAGRSKLILDITGLGGRLPLYLQKQDPQDLDDFARGFSDRMIAIVNQERQMSKA